MTPEPPVRILLLDDDEDEFLIVQGVLARARHRYLLDWSPRAAEALADMRRTGHDLYLVDYRLGARDGVEVIREAVGSGVRAPMILLTGATAEGGEHEVDIEALRAGAADYLEKPLLTPDTLDRAIRYARERAHVSALREELGRAEQEGRRLQTLLQQVQSQALRERLLAEASSIFTAATTEVEDAALFWAIAELLVPRLADWCAIHVLDGARLEAVAAVRRSPDGERPLRAPELDLRQLSPGRGANQVMRTGKPELYPELSEGAVAEVLGPPGGAGAAGVRSAMVVPVIEGGTPRAAISLARGSDGLYGESDLELMTEVARRVALVLENAHLYRDLQRAVQAREEFLAVASHELKTPLAALLIQVEGLERLASSDPALQRFVERLEKAASAGRRLGDLINELLDVSRLTAVRLELEPEPLALDQLAKDVVERFSGLAARTHTRLALQAEASVRGTWDRLRMEQVFTNLISNALKYGRGKPVTVEVFSSGNDAVVRVSDQGIGIAPEKRGRIFERFERAVTVREYGGFGLGLWIVRRIVEASGGTVEVESQQGRGSTFTVKLPLHAPPAEHACADRA